jgi:tripartite-type tricarboxylate transporter receptor subunit TctC
MKNEAIHVGDASEVPGQVDPAGVLKTAMRCLLSAMCGLTVNMALICDGAHAQSPGDRATTIVVPFSPGGGTDVLARAIAPKLGDKIGTSVVIENRPGAGAINAAMLTVRAAADGKTLMMASSGEFGINPGLFPKLPYDPLRDFTAVAPVASTPMVMVVHPSSPLKTVVDVVAMAHAQPGKINFGSGGNGSGSHMAAELFLNVTKTRMTHVPYKGSAPSLADLIGTQREMVVFTSLASGAAMIRSGQVRAVAVSSRHRLANLPDVPTFIESGVTGYEIEYWYGLVAPVGLAPELRARLNTAVADILRQPDVMSTLAAQGVRPLVKSPDEFSEFIAADIERWRTVIRSANIKPDQ